MFPDSIDHEAEITVVNANGATVGKPLRLALLNPVYEVWERTDTVASVGQETCLFGLDGKILAKREMQIRAG